MTPKDKIKELTALLDKGQFNDAQIGLTRALDENPTDPDLLNFWQTLQKRRAGLFKSMNRDIEARQLRCTSCGAVLSLNQVSARMTTCLSCGERHEVDGDVLRAIGKTESIKRPFESFLRLGMIGRFEGRNFQVIGHLIYESFIREWDREDAMYYTETWHFDEWTLVGEDGQLLYLAEDQEGFRLSREFTPTKPGIPEEKQSHFNLKKEGSPKRIRETGETTLLDFEGEFTYRPRIGEKARYAEYREQGKTYSVEWSFEKDNKAIREIEFFCEDRISRPKLMKALNLQEELRREKERKIIAKAKQKVFRKWAYLFFGFSALLLFFACYSYFKPGIMIFQDSVPLQNVTENGLLVGPFEMKRVNRVHAIDLSATYNGNHSVLIGAELVNSTGSAINIFEGDFWRESGYDSEGPWTESSTKETHHFRLNAPGSYSVRLFKGTFSWNNGSVRVVVREGVWLSRYFLFCALILMGCALFLFGRGETVSRIGSNE